MVVPYKICFFPCNAYFASLRAIPEARNAYMYAAAKEEGGGDREKERMRASDAKYEMYSKGEGGGNLMEPKNIDTIDMICMVNSHVKLPTHSTEYYCTVYNAILSVTNGRCRV